MAILLVMVDLAQNLGWEGREERACVQARGSAQRRQQQEVVGLFMRPASCESMRGVNNRENQSCAAGRKPLLCFRRREVDSRQAARASVPEAASACVRSAMMSSICSMPTESRT